MLLREFIKIIEILISKRDEPNTSADLKEIHQTLVRSQNIAAENQHSQKLEISNLTVRLDYMENRETPNLDFEEGLNKFNSLFDKVKLVFPTF